MAELGRTDTSSDRSARLGRMTLAGARALSVQRAKSNLFAIVWSRDPLTNYG
jgi:hypothetical protein